MNMSECARLDSSIEQVFKLPLIEKSKLFIGRENYHPNQAYQKEVEFNKTSRLSERHLRGMPDRWLLSTAIKAWRNCSVILTTGLMNTIISAPIRGSAARAKHRCKLF